MKMRTLTVASVATVTAMAAGLAMGESITIDLAGINSNDNLVPERMRALFDSLVGVTITGIGYNVVGNGDDTGVTWGNEMTMAVVDDLNGVFISFFQMREVYCRWRMGSCFKRGHHRLAAQGLEFTTGSGGLLLSSSSYDDVVGATDSHYESGTVTIEYAVPAPGALALLGLAESLAVVVDAPDKFDRGPDSPTSDSSLNQTDSNFPTPPRLSGEGVSFLVRHLSVAA